MLQYIDIQNLANRATWDEGRYYQKHRQESMSSLRQAVHLVGRPEQFLVVGVGNANDLDLPELVGMAPKVWLADIDRASVERALARQGLQKSSQEGEHEAVRQDFQERLRVWIGDAGGSAQEIDDFLRAVSPQLSLQQMERLPVLTEALQRLAKRAEDYRLDADEAQVLEPGLPSTGFDLVVSQCVLSQILWPVTQAVWETAGIPWQEGQAKLVRGAQESLYPELARALHSLALGHLAWVERRLRPGGMLVINTDVSWQGVPLYGTDVEAALANMPPSQGRKWAALQLSGPKEWEWHLDEATRALVRSYRIKKASL
ncbi:MAG: hypothetical protein QMC95_01430 [Desulfitobacteriaceae bacterium]|nr:hypothetical protein [Desulfitobacteriaceae bacterium]MDI6877797.1 hypothetical protein [Desulfitobacteriaceae bacterium]MDI6912864.1 hypothetical protein [Desulfitobacteriaceae bacterium]